jgi:hypothetical protein
MACCCVPRIGISDADSAKHNPHPARPSVGPWGPVLYLARA